MKELLLINERKHTFTVDANVQGEAVSGEFTAHYPSIKDEIKIQSILSGLLQGADLENYPLKTYNTAYALAYLEVVLEKSPEWFDADKIDDTDVIFTVYGEVMKFVNSFRTTDGGNENKGSGDKAEDTEIVEGE